ncbi:hypothetical protein V6N12_024194 [Hibiscus sabdariffa]|uniref:Uncharacterized protein n=1 Tax=Hibiscus sabdariffa TaxID=183260 RepID=A0ABR2FZU9_9ROSI
MGFNPINLDNIFEEEDPLSAWIKEREGPMLDSEHNFSWLHEELLIETNEETQGEDINDILHEENVQLSTSSCNDGDDGPSDNNEVFKYPSVVDLGSLSHNLATNDYEISESS